MEKIAEKAAQLGCSVKENEPLSQHTTFKAGGSAALFIEVRSESQLKGLLSALNEAKAAYFLLGNGSNVLAPDEGYGGIVLSLAGDFKKISRLDDNTVFCGAGVNLAKLCLYAADNHLSGMEFAWGIPATLGGAVYMNAGAYGSEMKNVIVSCRYMDPVGEIHTVYNEAMDLSYRKSMFIGSKNIILGAVLRFTTAPSDSIRAQMDEFMTRRREKQPLEYPSAGSTFKRPRGQFAGALIEGCGLKGASVGGAQVSEKHAGFVINRGGASSEDIKRLIKKVQETVLEQTGYFLEREVIYM